MTRLIALLAAGAVSLMSTGVAAQALCGERAHIVDRLDLEFSETPQALGLSEDGALVEVMVSPSGSWTILVTYPQKLTCVVATGDGWESLIVPVPQVPDLAA